MNSFDVTREKWRLFGVEDLIHRKLLQCRRVTVISCNLQFLGPIPFSGYLFVSFLLFLSSRSLPSSLYSALFSSYPPSFLLHSTPASTHSFIISISSFLSLLSLLFPFFPCLFCVHWSSKSSSFPMSQFLFLSPYYLQWFRTWLYQMNQRASFFIKKEKTKGHFTRSDFIHIFVIYPKKKKRTTEESTRLFSNLPCVLLNEEKFGVQSDKWACHKKKNSNIVREHFHRSAEPINRRLF